MTSKSFKLWWNSGSVGRGDDISFHFGERHEKINAAKLTNNRMKQANTLSMTRREMRFLAKDL